jgi:tryptophan synthase alpha chain
MNRIDTAFANARSHNRAAFVAYVCAGDPDLDTSFEVCRTLIGQGTDILEIGVPFSDPLADGLTNQLAAERALRAGMNQQKVFQLVRRIRAFSQVPIILYTYYNLSYSQGLDDYARTAAEAGVDGVLTLDLPPEEAAEWETACKRHNLGTVYIIAPTSPESRIRTICSHATAFIYYVSAEGVTGERDQVAADLAARLDAIRAHASRPVVVGFGISRREHVRTVAAVADGVVVGSALVNCIARHQDNPQAILHELSTKLAELLPGLARE